MNKEVQKGTEAHSLDIPWVCKKRSISTLIFEINTVFEDAMGWCNQLGGMVPFPKTQNQSLELIIMLKKAIKGKYACEHFWMPIVQTLKPDETERSEHKNNAHSEGSHDSEGHKRKRGASPSDEKSEDSEMELKKLSKIA